jgi:hypothetical protein
MSDADELYYRWIDSVQKFDYFVVGLCVAIVGYLAGKIEPALLGLNAHTLELVALALLVGATYCGLKRIAGHNMGLIFEHLRIGNEAAAKALRSAAAAGAPGLNLATGELVGSSEVAAQAQHKAALVDEVKKIQKRWGDWAAGWYRWRDRLMIAGLVCLILSKAIAAL